MKKLLTCLMTLMMIAAVSAGALGETLNVALITDIGTIDDKAFNQSAWEGIRAYADQGGAACRFYQPTLQSNEAYLQAIDKAVTNGATIIVAPGAVFEEAIGLAQERYPQVAFILLDGVPRDQEGNEVVRANTLSIVFSEEEAGFLAGYAAVREGYTRLGVIGGPREMEEIRYSYGFAQGAELAAEEMGLKEISIRLHFTGSREASPEAQMLSASWYGSGVEAILVCGGEVRHSVMAAALEANRAVICTDTDGAHESVTVVTSAVKDIAAAVKQALDMACGESFPGGQCLRLGARESGVKLSMDTSRFQQFSAEDYDAILARLMAGDIRILGDTNQEGGPVTIDQLPLSAVHITLVN